MQVSEYQRAARTTAIYPAAAGVYYPALGLAGELGEIANKVKKIIRGDVTLADRRDDLKKEIGDVMWYVAALASDLGVELRNLANIALEESEHPGRVVGDVYSVVLKLQSYAGKIAEISDDARTHGLTDHRRLLLRYNLVQVIVRVTDLCSHIGADLTDICKDNIQKLFARKEAGTIKGDGDNR